MAVLLQRLHSTYLLVEGAAMLEVASTTSPMAFAVKDKAEDMLEVRSERL
jgi:hypothetical protein